MSCHSTHGGVALTSYARAVSDSLDEGQIASVYHRVKREGKNQEPPSVDETVAFLAAQQRAIENDPQLEDATKKRIIARLEKAEEAARKGAIPDGGTFHAWNQVAVESEITAKELDRTVRSSARLQRTNPERLQAKFNKWRRDPDSYEDVQVPDSTFEVANSTLPTDKRTSKALRKLAFENYLAQRHPVFVYGTLRKGQPNEGVIYEPSVADRMEGRIDGVAIYGPDQGFPYAQESPDGEGYTVGEMVELTDDHEGDITRNGMDGLEGFDSDHYSDSHYQRVLKNVSYTAPDGSSRTQQAWVYLAGSWAAQGLREEKRIHDGDWVKAKDAYRKERGVRTYVPRVHEPDDVPTHSAEESAAAFMAAFAAADKHDDGDDEHAGFLSTQQ